MYRMNYAPRNISAQYVDIAITDIAYTIWRGYSQMV